jgi:CO/xanthine dehydrogenase Mo-binding subunit
MARRRQAEHSVGENVPRAEGHEKVIGAARYVDDLTFPGMLFGRTVRSTIPRGRILSVSRDPAFDWSGFVFVEARDVPGRNVVAMIATDQPFLADGRVEHREEPILLLAHEDRARADAAVAHVTVEYAAEPAVLELERATELLKEIRIEKGDLARGFAEADRVIEGEYETGHQEQLYIEPNGAIALPEPAGGITVYGSMQCPYDVHRALSVLLGAEGAQVRVVQTTTGGGFGGKEEYPSLICGHAALLARKAGRPVKMVYDRLEDLAATTKRHPSRIRHRTGVKRDGTITAMEIDLRLDGGAYVTLSPVVLSRASIHASGPYRSPAVRIHGRAFKTNTPPNGAFRGFGAPQSQFAAERHMDAIAGALGMDPIALRRKNLYATGDVTATGQVLRDEVAMTEVLDRALARHKKGAPKRSPKDGTLRGTGLALFFHGSGFTGSGEVKLASRAAVALTPRGVALRVGSTEIGQGTRTMLAQIVADTLALPYAWIETADPDTARVPDSGPTVASRTCMVVGRILQLAARNLSAAVGAYRTPEEFRARARTLLAGRDELTFEAQYDRPGDIRWSDETYQGDAYGAYAWGANLADVEVDPVTYQVRCTRLTAVIDIGRAIHPILATGQIEGGSLQAVGWALYEEVVMRDGRMANGQLTNYIIPTTLDTPAMAVEIVENPYPHGPFGAKGVGECPIDGPAAAILAAIQAACGARLASIPATPERIFAALTKGGR